MVGAFLDATASSGCTPDLNAFASADGTDEPSNSVQVQREQLVQLEIEFLDLKAIEN